MFSEMDTYLDLDYMHVDLKLEETQEQNSCGTKMEIEAEQPSKSVVTTPI